MPFITQGKSNVKYLLIVVLAAVVAGGIIFAAWSHYQKESSNIDQTLRTKQANKFRVSTDVVWGRVLDRDILSALQKCDYSSLDCVIAVMLSNGASPEAIKFFKEEKWFVTKFINYGKVSLLEVVDPWRANSNEDYVLVNGKQRPITIEGSVGSVEGEVFKTFPKDTLWGTDNSFSGKNGNFFIFNVELKNGCHACNTGYDAMISFDFDQDGNYLGEHLVGFCTEEGTKDNKYSGCILSQTDSNTETADWKTYRNDEYGFEMTLLDSWKGYSSLVEFWSSETTLDGELKKFQGPKIIIRNPKWTKNNPWQDISIVVFTKEEWELVEAEKLNISGAPVGPEKMGENQNYVFAFPPRWMGYQNELGQNEALEIVKTFKAF